MADYRGQVQPFASESAAGMRTPGPTGAAWIERQQSVSPPRLGLVANRRAP